jgi:arylsulfatase A-like enzyme
LVVPPAGIDLPAFEEPVGLIDVATTLAAIGGAGRFGIGSDIRESSDGRSVQVEFFGDVRKARAHGRLAGLPARSVVRGPFKLIEQDGGQELYRIDRDPEERTDLAASHPEEVRALGELLPPLSDDPDRPQVPLDLSPAEDEALRKLGYIE